MALLWGAEAHLVWTVKHDRRDGASGRLRAGPARRLPSRRPGHRRRRHAADDAGCDEHDPGASHRRRPATADALTIAARRAPEPGRRRRAGPICSTSSRSKRTSSAGVSPQISLQRVFGGQVAGQALVAAGRTVDPRPAGALAALLLHPARRSVRPDRLPRSTGCATDARSRPAGRRGPARRGDLHSCPRRSSWPRPASSTSRRCRTCPRRRRCRRSQDRYERIRGRGRGLCAACRGRSTCATSTTRRGCSARTGPRDAACTGSGCGPTATLPDDPLLHVCALTFASDLTAARLGAGPARPGRRRSTRSRWRRSITRCGSIAAVPRRRVVPLRDELAVRLGWPRPGGGRIFARDGRHVASVVQEGMIRVPSA